MQFPVVLAESLLDHALVLGLVAGPATIRAMDQMFVLRPVHVFRLFVMSETAVRRVDRRAVVIMVAHHAVRVVDGVASMSVVFDHPAVRPTLDVHDAVAVGVGLSAAGVVVRNLVVFGRTIRSAVVAPHRRGVTEPEITVSSAVLAVEKIAFDMLDCHNRGSYRFPMSGYLR